MLLDLVLIASHESGVDHTGKLELERTGRVFFLKGELDDHARLPVIFCDNGSQRSRSRMESQVAE
jgi:hypothetical protein